MPDIEVDVSNKTFFVKEQPTFPTSDMSTHKTFVSGGQTFSQITVYSDGEVWYGSDTVAYANGEWEIEYRYLTFGANQTMSSSDYDKFVMVYDEYTAGAKKLYFRIDDGEYKLATLNGKNNGVWDGVAWDNSEVPPIPTGETWLIKASGISYIGGAVTANINFTSNGYNYTQFNYYSETNLAYNSTVVYSGLGWVNENYRTVYFPEPPTGALRLWLNANATLQ